MCRRFSTCCSAGTLLRRPRLRRLDPSVAPGTSVPSPGGLSYLEAAALFAGLAGRGQVVGMNVAEHYPSLDVNGITSLVIARLIAIWNGSLRLPVAGGAATLRSGQR